jgi:hypothetical protein
LKPNQFHHTKIAKSSNLRSESISRIPRRRPAIAIRFTVFLAYTTSTIPPYGPLSKLPSELKFRRWKAFFVSQWLLGTVSNNQMRLVLRIHMSLLIIVLEVTMEAQWKHNGSTIEAPWKHDASSGAMLETTIV